MSVRFNIPSGAGGGGTQQPDHGTWIIRKAFDGTSELGGTVGYVWVVQGPKDFQTEYFAFGDAAWADMPFTRDIAFIKDGGAPTHTDLAAFASWATTKLGTAIVSKQMAITRAYGNGQEW